MSGVRSSDYTRLVAAGVTDIGRTREINEDNILVLSDLGLYVVADGMGGHSAGDVASSMATASLDSFFRSSSQDGGAALSQENPKSDGALLPEAQTLVTAIRKANQELWAISSTHPQHKGMGSTVVAALVSRRDGRIHIAHVGDSRCYRIRDGEIEQLTRDHSLINEALALKPDLTPAQLARLPKNVITRALGMAAMVQVDVRSEEIQPGDMFLLCSDGLTGMVSEDRILEILGFEEDVQEACELLVALANDAGGTDNISALVIRVEEVFALGDAVAEEAPVSALIESVETVETVDSVEVESEAPAISANMEALSVEDIGPPSSSPTTEPEPPVLPPDSPFLKSAFAKAMLGHSGPIEETTLVTGMAPRFSPPTPPPPALLEEAHPAEAEAEPALDTSEPPMSAPMSARSLEAMSGPMSARSLEAMSGPMSVRSLEDEPTWITGELPPSVAAAVPSSRPSLVPPSGVPGSATIALPVEVIAKVLEAEITEEPAAAGAEPLEGIVKPDGEPASAESVEAGSPEAAAEPVEEAITPLVVEAPEIVAESSATSETASAEAPTAKIPDIAAPPLDPARVEPPEADLAAAAPTPSPDLIEPAEALAEPSKPPAELDEPAPAPESAKLSTGLANLDDAPEISAEATDADISLEFVDGPEIDADFADTFVSEEVAETVELAEDDYAPPASVARIAHCRNCGHELLIGNLFCVECGTRIEG